MDLDAIIKEASEKLDIPYDVARRAYMLYWKSVRETVKSIPVKEDYASEEEFNKLRRSVNIPRIGKFVFTWDRYVSVRRQLERSKKFKSENNVEYKENETDVHGDNNDL